MTFMTKKLILTEREQLKKIVKKASERAIRENKALGLPITYLEDGKIIKEYANGTKEVLRVKEKVQGSPTIKKGTILHVKKKTN
jgi:hypothetical protein